MPWWLPSLVGKSLKCTHLLPIGNYYWLADLFNRITPPTCNRVFFLSRLIFSGLSTRMRKCLSQVWNKVLTGQMRLICTWEKFGWEFSPRGLQTLLLFKTKSFNFNILFKTRDLYILLEFRIFLSPLFFISHTESIFLNKWHHRISSQKICWYPHVGFKASSPERHPVQDTKWWNCIPCLRCKTLKTLPCWVAHTHFSQIRECPPPRLV